MRGDIAAALNELRAQYDIGADPAVVLADLAEFTHFVTRVKMVPAVADDPALIEIERARGRACAEKLSMRVLSRTWQMLLKGMAEVDAAGRPLAAAEMVLVRIAYAADLPTPEEVIRSLDENGQAAPRAGACGRCAACRGGLAPRFEAPRFEASRVETSRGATARCARAVQRSRARLPRGSSQAAPALVVGRFEDLIALAAQKRDLGVKLALERDVRLVRCEDGRLEIATGAERGEDVGQRSGAQVLAMDQPALDGRRIGRAGRADGQVAERGAPGRAQDRRARRSAGAGRARALSRRRDRGRAQGRRCRWCRRRTMPVTRPELASDEGRSGFEDYGRQPMPKTISEAAALTHRLRHRRVSDGRFPRPDETGR